MAAVKATKEANPKKMKDQITSPEKYRINVINKNPKIRATSKLPKITCHEPEISYTAVSIPATGSAFKAAS